MWPAPANQVLLWMTSALLSCVSCQLYSGGAISTLPFSGSPTGERDFYYGANNLPQQQQQQQYYQQPQQQQVQPLSRQQQQSWLQQQQLQQQQYRQQQQQQQQHQPQPQEQQQLLQQQQKGGGIVNSSPLGMVRDDELRQATPVLANTNAVTNYNNLRPVYSSTGDLLAGQQQQHQQQQRQYQQQQQQQQQRQQKLQHQERLQQIVHSNSRPSVASLGQQQQPQQELFEKGGDRPVPIEILAMQPSSVRKSASHGKASTTLRLNLPDEIVERWLNELLVLIRNPKCVLKQVIPASGGGGYAQKSTLFGHVPSSGRSMSPQSKSILRSNQNRSSNNNSNSSNGNNNNSNSNNNRNSTIDSRGTVMGHPDMKVVNITGDVVVRRKTEETLDQLKAYNNLPSNTTASSSQSNLSAWIG